MRIIMPSRCEEPHPLGKSRKNINVFYGRYLLWQMHSLKECTRHDSLHFFGLLFLVSVLCGNYAASVVTLRLLLRIVRRSKSYVCMKAS